MQTRSAARPHFRLLSLPPELRLRIYTLALFPLHHAPQTLTLYRTGLHVLNDLKANAAILRLNKQIHTEAMPLLYDKVIYEICLGAVLPGQYGSWRPGGRGRQWEWRPKGVKSLLPEERKKGRRSPRFVIGAESLRRLRWVEVRIARGPGGEGELRGRRFCEHRVGLLLAVLRVLAHATANDGGGGMAAEERKGMLRLVVEPDVLGEALFDSEQMWRVVREFLDRVGKVREVEAVDEKGVFWKWHGEQE